MNKTINRKFKNKKRNLSKTKKRVEGIKKNKIGGEGEKNNIESEKINSIIELLNNDFKENKELLKRNFNIDKKNNIQDILKKVKHQKLIYDKKNKEYFNILEQIYKLKNLNDEEKEKKGKKELDIYEFKITNVNKDKPFISIRKSLPSYDKLKNLFLTKEELNSNNNMEILNERLNQYNINSLFSKEHIDTIFDIKDRNNNYNSDITYFTTGKNDKLKEFL